MVTFLILLRIDKSFKISQDPKVYFGKAGSATIFLTLYHDHVT